MIHPDGFYYYLINGEPHCYPTEQTKHSGKEIEPTEEPYKTIHAQYSANEYSRNRQAEYPTALELIVALYDTDDKSAIEAKREAVKAKYPKPE
jgi:hypothetical protein